MKRLLVFRSLAHDPQCVLAGVHRLALVGVKLCLNIIALELGATSFADAESRRGLLYDPQFALGHDLSLAQSAGRQ